MRNSWLFDSLPSLDVTAAAFAQSFCCIWIIFSQVGSLVIIGVFKFGSLYVMLLTHTEGNIVITGRSGG